MSIYLYWWYSGSEYLLGGVFTEKAYAVAYMEAEWVKNEMQLHSKPYFVQETRIDIPRVTDPYNTPESEMILPEGRGGVET